MKNFVTICATLFIVLILISIGSVFSKIDSRPSKISKDSILVMDLEGIILDGRKFLEDLRKYSAQEHVKGVLIRVNSPGGAVGPSQEIYSAIKKVKEELKKPVVVSCLAVAASGGYYAALAADQIITNPGSLLGSIGVIMEFANLEKLYDWAKIQRYVIKSGKFKDSGSDHRSMTEEERALFQDLIDDVENQFKQAVIQGRKLSSDVVDKYADGRVFTGQTAVKLGFADQVGTFADALKIVGELAGLGDKPETFTPPKKRPEFLEMLTESEGPEGKAVDLFKKVFKTQLMGQPLYLMPGVLGE